MCFTVGSAHKWLFIECMKDGLWGVHIHTPASHLQKTEWGPALQIHSLPLLMAWVQFSVWGLTPNSQNFTINSTAACAMWRPGQSRLHSENLSLKTTKTKADWLDYLIFLVFIFLGGRIWLAKYHGHIIFIASSAFPNLTHIFMLLRWAKGVFEIASYL